MGWNSQSKTFIIEFDASSTEVSNSEVSSYKTTVVTIIIESGYLSIPDLCFRDYTALTTLEMPDSIESIGDGIIINTKITEIHIPLNTKSINEGNSFDSTQKTLKTYTISEMNNYFAVLDDSLYSKMFKILYHYPPAKQDKIFQIRNGVEMISSTAIENNDYLETIIGG